MKRIFIIIGFTFLVATALRAATASGGADFERYRGILDRKPFGKITTSDTSATIAVTSAPTEALTKELELKAIIDGGNVPLRAGFLDKKTKKTFYLKVGEKNETYELLSVDYDTEEAVLRKGSETTIFNLKPNKTNTTPAGLSSAQGTPPGFTPFSAPGAHPTRGFAPVPNSSSKRPFFSDMKKRRFSPFKPMGTNMPVPFQSQSMENFMKANTNAPHGFPGQLRPFGSLKTNNSAGDTIDNFLRANPDAASKFSPLKPLDPNAANTENTGNTVQGFIIQDSDQSFQAQNLFLNGGEAEE